MNNNNMEEKIPLSHRLRGLKKTALHLYIKKLGSRNRDRSGSGERQIGRAE